ncbi:endoplasmic reticulum-Golgi intermediate compartment protein 2-like [Mytilus californianus]|uniref:endoplasmic reticulum-Golgi intermediate compartment protein 2-like n=1 Tax=Mytilus californianus TaxID=6549 RepID=UPI00224646F9|nr:endoplasmic reticulum-Golgi intermediate compartment protein 2-like [Mytilus californianus]XP_052067431.1 endoplasmic reticulum-Golgi intermediate compartment protein 2-like [Mytilus californianus]XP_052067432.1 endoplasmic reticulum-Golgi intermediate compartment protein 2-like [Mytilus californianus]
MRRLNAVNRKQALKVVKELDAFPKVLDDYKETTATGGGVSLAVFAVIIILVLSEVIYYARTELKFDYEVDTQMDGKLKINIDITVAMRCNALGADVVDSTGQNFGHQNFGSLEMDDTYFELSTEQRRYLDIIQDVNKYLREEYHAIQELMWLSGSVYTSFRKGMPERKDKPSHRPDACRIHGTLIVNKVAGNFHITAGKSIPVFPSGHAHISFNIGDNEMNYTHRINHLSFGDIVHGVVSPLDGEEKITKDNYHLFQYFIQVVPTEVRTYRANVDTYQYAVTERNRTINHAKGSHGISGIFYKYDLNSLKIRVREQHQPIWQFLVRLCGIIGGVFSVAGMMRNWSGFLADIICCRFHLGKYKESDSSSPSSQIFTQSLTDESSFNNSPKVNLLQSGT